MELPAKPRHLQALIEKAQERAEVIRTRMAWVEERRRELWRRMDSLEEATPLRHSGAAPVPEALVPAAGGAMAEDDLVPVYPLA